MKPSMHIAVIGYGSAGQALAVALSGDGHRVEVFERVPDPGPVGAGFLLQPTGLSVLWQLGLLDAALEHGAVVRRLHGETTASRTVMDMRYRELHPALFGLGLQRGAIFELLDRAWTEARRIHCGRGIVHVDHERGLLRDDLGDEHGPFDLVVVADGSASKLRAEIGEVVFDRPYPWGAQWCLVPAGDWPWPDELRQRYRHARRMVGMLPVGTRPGDPIPRLSFFWSLPAAALPDAGRDEARWRAEVAEIWPDAVERLQTTAVPDGLAQARYRDTVVRRWHRGRAVLVGDAAHSMSPQLGQGVNMALADALALRDALRAASALPEALDAYQRERRRHLDIYHFWSRWLTPLFQSEHDVVAGLRDLLFHPLSRVPGGRGQSLRILTGTRRGWFGRWPLPPDFIERLSNAGESR
ncbi:MAG: FAD-dependent monooxygenase [Xanthomonadales bacterium]|nr:FAD-dependent monooxygenase [Xanthomonadales bacterium]